MKKVIVFLILMFSICAKAQDFSYYCSENVAKKSFSGGIMSLSGFNMISRNIAENILEKEIIADITPLFKAVKNADANILNPLIKCDNEYILIAVVVISNNSLSYPTNMLARGFAKISANTVITIDVIVINFKLFPNKFRNSFLSPAP